MFQKNETTQTQGKKVRTFLKWVGGKTKSLFKIYRNYPRQGFTKYVEPFLGSGIVMLDAIANHQLSSVVGNDANQELILTWEQIRDNVEEVIEKLKKLEDEYFSKDSFGQKNMFESIKRAYNESLTGNSEKFDDADTAAFFIFLNKTSLKGIYRVTSKNEMTSPWDDKNTPKQICEADLLREVSDLIKGVKFTATNFKATMNSVDENTFIFLDPPVVTPVDSQKPKSIFYIPSYLYCDKPFTATDFEEVKGYMDIASDKGASVLLVLPYKKEEEEFIASMFEGYKIRLVDYKKDNKDFNYSELYITNY